MLRFKNLFKSATKCNVIGMVHVGALPGAPLFKSSVDELVAKACHETELYLKHNIDGILIENMHDVPYTQSKYHGPEIVATMTRICTEIKKIVPRDFPCGIQILAAGNREALAVAKACSFNFIRAEGFVFSHVADEGFIDADAGQLLRYRKYIEADDILVFADIKKKHSSHAITGDVSLTETAEAAEFFLADGLILTGRSTGSPTDINEFQQVKNCTSLPILIGSGVTVDNLHQYLHSDGVIVGSHFKKGGKWYNELDEERLRSFMAEKINNKTFK